MESNRWGNAAREKVTDCCWKTALTIAILVLSITRCPVSPNAPHSQRQFWDQITHKQGEGLLVLGDLLFGQRIGLDGCDGAVSQIRDNSGRPAGAGRSELGILRSRVEGRRTKKLGGRASSIPWLVKVKEERGDRVKGERRTEEREGSMDFWRGRKLRGIPALRKRQNNTADLPITGLYDSGGQSSNVTS